MSDARSRFFTFEYRGNEQAIHRAFMAMLPELSASVAGEFELVGIAPAGRDPSISVSEEHAKAIEAAIAGHEGCKAGAPSHEHVDVLLDAIAERDKIIAALTMQRDALVE